MAAEAGRGSSAHGPGTHVTTIQIGVGREKCLKAITLGNLEQFIDSSLSFVSGIPCQPRYSSSTCSSTYSALILVLTHRNSPCHMRGVSVPQVRPPRGYARRRCCLGPGLRVVRGTAS